MIKSEEASFLSKLDDGLVRIEKIFDSMSKAGKDLVEGSEAAELYQTFGIPPELVEDQARERNLKFDWDGFKKAMEEFGVISGKIADTVMGGGGPIDEIKNEAKSTPFLGYETCESECEVIGLVQDGTRVDTLSSDNDEQQIVLNQTPFYAESGGQVADIGKLVGPNGEFNVTDVQKNGDVFVHHGNVAKGDVRQGDVVKAIVDSGRRDAIRRAHTATHVLHYSLQQTLGSHAQQRGSKVTDDWLRFDFSNLEPVSDEDLATIEEMTRERISTAVEVAAEILPLSEAKNKGAMMLFGEKYPDPVRMVSIGDFSRELCGGTHLSNSKDVGEFEIMVEESVSSGTRRIEATTGARAKANRKSIEQSVVKLCELFEVGASNIETAFENLATNIKELKKRVQAGNSDDITETKIDGGENIEYSQQRTVIRRLARSLNVAVDGVVERIEAMFAEKKKLKEQLKTLENVEKVDADILIASATEVGGIRIVAKELAASNPNLMRQLIDQVRKKVNPVAVFLATSMGDDKVILVAGVSKDLIEMGIKAGDWVKEIAPIVGGGGGGKPDMAQAGGKKPDMIPQALDTAIQYLSEKATAKN